MIHVIPYILSRLKDFYNFLCSKYTSKSQVYNIPYILGELENTCSFLDLQVYGIYAISYFG